MAREIAPGSELNSIVGSTRRHPGFQILIWDPRCATINQIAIGLEETAALDITAWVERINLQENIGFENGDDPTVTSANFEFRRNRVNGTNIRRGWIEDGVIVRILQGDERVRKSEWVPIFTGTFRGRPGDNPGIPANLSQGLAASAYGREERFLNLTITTESFPEGTDVGEIATVIAQKHMGLGQDEILIGVQGFKTKHLTTQLVELNALQALWEVLFPVNKKPKFDARGRLVAVDVDFDKPPLRIYSAGDILIRSKVASPNEVEVANKIVIRGLDAELTRIVSADQVLASLEATTGFFDEKYEKDVYYSEDRTQRAQNTHLVTVDKIKWSDAEWSESDEFHGNLNINTNYLRNARAIIFAVYLATKIIIAYIDYYFQGGQLLAIVLSIFGISITVATIRLIFELLSLAALAALLWAMQFIGTGQYEIHGRPFEYVYQELITEAKLVGVEIADLRVVEFRNDLLSSMDELDAQAQVRLRRELVKNQLFQIEIMDDPVLEVDDIIETKSGERFYIVSVSKEISSEGKMLTLSTWKIFDRDTAAIEALELGASV